jgi:N6-L-threonylcarbamoyladenine synthase
VLRKAADQLALDESVEVFYPRLEFCTDNGAMIALAGAKRLSRGECDNGTFGVLPRWSLDTLS